jgi:hypothetical protein
MFIIMSLRREVGVSKKRGIAERVAVKIYGAKRVWVPFIAKRAARQQGTLWRVAL